MFFIVCCNDLFDLVGCIVVVIGSVVLSGSVLEYSVAVTVSVAVVTEVVVAIVVSTVVVAIVVVVVLLLYFFVGIVGKFKVYFGLLVV